MGLTGFDYSVDLWVVILISICIIVLLAFIINRVIHTYRRQVATGREELVGKTAEVMVPLSPKGIVLFRGERWTAISETGMIEPGEVVVIIKIENLKLYVTKREKEVNI